MKLVYGAIKEGFGQLQSKLDPYFARSDSDYVIFINPKLDNYSDIYLKVNKLTTQCLSRL